MGNKLFGWFWQERFFWRIFETKLSITELLLNGKDGEIYNVGNPSPEVNMVELANKFYESLGAKPNYDLIDYPDDYPDDEPLRRCPNIDKVVAHTNIIPIVDFKRGIKNM